MPRCALVISIVLVAVSGGAGALPVDTLSSGRGVLVITREELEEYSIHTLEDVLLLVPGAAIWRAGPPGAESAFSLDGRNPRGVLLLLNGEPLMEPYSFDQLSRFLPLSRLERIEVHYEGSPMLSGQISTAAAVNVVLEEGGREAPNVELDFTYGSSNRRARRAWFATPDARITAVIAYDEYLQDAFESYPADLSHKLGKYDSRSVLTELILAPDPDRVATVRFQRFDDTYLGTHYSASEDIRHDGYDARLGIRIEGFDVSFRQRLVNTSRRHFETSALDLEGSVRWAGSFRDVGARLFFTAARSSFENVMRGEHFDPSMHRLEGGASAMGVLAIGLSWRAGAYAGQHSEAGEYICGEAGISLDGFFSPRLHIARRIRVPTVQELFQPESLLAPDGSQYLTGGNPLLEPELSDELSAGARLGATADLELFVRNEKRRIAGVDGTFETLDGGETAGARGRIFRGGSLYGIEYRVSASVEYFERRSAYSFGVPEYRGLGGVLLGRKVFKDTETISVRYDAELVGKRPWSDDDLGAYTVHDVSASLTLLTARIVFQLKNLLDEQYETLPGFLMPGRHYIIGVWWELID
jgi:hypothetical protein